MPKGKKNVATTNDGTPAVQTDPTTRKIQLATLALTRLELPAGRAVIRLLEATVAHRRLSDDRSEECAKSCNHLYKAVMTARSDVQTLSEQLNKLAIELGHGITRTELQRMDQPCDQATPSEGRIA